MLEFGGCNLVCISSMACTCTAAAPIGANCTSPFLYLVVELIEDILGGAAGVLHGLQELPGLLQVEPLRLLRLVGGGGGTPLPLGGCPAATLQQVSSEH